MTDTICDTKLSFGRVEIRTGVGRRRRWTALEKGRIVAEALNAGVPVAEIARRHDMSSQHLFSWIRAAKEGRLALPADEVAVFVPVAYPVDSGSSRCSVSRGRPREVARTHTRWPGRARFPNSRRHFLTKRAALRSYSNGAGRTASSALAAASAARRF